MLYTIYWGILKFSQNDEIAHFNIVDRLAARNIK